jgi:Flp pilus assembly protein TadG
MKLGRIIRQDERGAAAIEAAFALPVLVVMIWMLAQLGGVYRALAGIQMALGEGARFATVCTPTALGCTSPTRAQVKTKVESAVYGTSIGGSFNVPTPTCGASGTSQYYDVTITYTQPTSLLLVPGPTINLGRSKRVWIAAPISATCT